MYINTTSSQALTDHSSDSPPATDSLEIRHEFASNSVVPRGKGGSSKGGGRSKGGGGGSFNKNHNHNNNRKECGERVKETFNKDAVYTVISKESVLCDRWISDVLAVCPDVEEFSLDEGPKNAITPADHRLSSVSGLFGPNGSLSARGDTNSTISDCVTNEFDRIAAELKQDPAHDTGRNLGGIVGGVAGGLVLIGVIVFCRKRCSAWFC